MKFYKIFAFGIILLLLWNGNANSRLFGFVNSKYKYTPLPTDSTKIKNESIESFPQKEEDKSQFLPNPKAVVRDVKYDYKTNLYLVTEKVNGKNVKPPMYLTYDEYLALSDKKEFSQFVETKNANQKSDDITTKNNPLALKYKLPNQGIFGEGDIEIKPQGNLDIQMGYNHNTVRNPSLTPIQQTQGLIDFDMAMNVSVMGKIGDKFQNTLRYNNQSSFGFEGQRIKLAYNGKEDEIIRNLEAGDVSFEVPTQLIKSAQALWGFRTELQFGKLNIKAALSQQRSSRQSKTIENGTESQSFEVTVDQYDQFRHFFLCQMFRDNYEKSLENYPLINSPFQVTNVEVWVSNRSVQTQSVRDVVTFHDLGESDKKLSPNIFASATPFPASNSSNDLYDKIKRNGLVRNANTAQQTLQSPPFNLVAYQDFEKGFLRKLNPNEYFLNSKLGYISLNSTLQPNDILAVSFQYVYKGNVFQVGDLSRDITLPDTSSPDPSRVLYLKTLKGTNINPTFPNWDLMMKNVYNLNGFQISKDNFRLDIFYNDPGAGVKRYLPKGTLQNEPLIRTLGVDRLNLNNEPYPDGVYDFVATPEPITINPNNGKIYFPVLEPFGSHLKDKLIKSGNSDLVKDYVYQYLYDSTQFIALQYPELNRFLIKGTFQSSTNKRIPLGLNTPQGSVYVTMNGQRLNEGTDYIVEYGSLGYIELMDHVMSSGGKVQIEYENNIAFGLQTRNFMGTRLEYRFNDKFKIGTTYEKLSERPFNNKILYGEDPINNQILGGDISYASNFPFLTKLLDALPFYKTSEMSTVNIYAEYARLFPGHYQTIGDAGTIYLDDFEGASINYNFGNPANLWRLASTPQGAKDESGRILFPESGLIDSLQYGFNRAKLAWYNIAPLHYFGNNIGPQFPPSVLKDLYQRQYVINDIYPNRYVSSTTNLIQTFDLNYFPNQRGPYNYESSSSPSAISQGVNNDGSLKNPKTRWAGLQRSIENTNFETNNIEFIQFWMLDPFLKNINNSGDLYFNLGYVSEDVLKDSRLEFEQGLVNRKSLDSNQVVETRWSWIPKTQPLINAFSNEANLRPFQDIGLDGTSDADERLKFNSFLTNVASTVNPSELSKLQNDPSSDNFKHYLNNTLPQNSLVGLYKEFNGVDNNSPLASTGIPQSNYASPDNEDINRDNTLNENEAYFQYRVKLYPGMDVGSHPYIVSKTISQDAIDPNTGQKAVWYQFRIPLREYSHRQGQIGDFRNIQFVRMFVTNFQDSAIMRMTDLAFVRNQWRKYNGSIQSPTDVQPRDNGEREFFDVGAVGLEENANKTPVSYVTPAGIIREVGLNASSNPIQLNEQSLRLSFCNLKDGGARACFKNIDFDFRQYKTLKIFAHAENNDSLAINTMRDNDVSAFIRLGSDFKDNYYEYEIPLKVSPPGIYDNNKDADKRIVWPDINQMTVQIQDMVNAKFNRNKSGYPVNTPYVFKTADNRNITIVGNPDLGLVKVAMLGIRNRALNDVNNFKTDDDGMPKCGEVWLNEMRLEGLNEQGGSAAIGNIEVKLADLGTASFSSSLHTVGYGQIYERVNERKRDDYYQYNFTTNLQLHKLLPKFLGLQLPFYFQTGQSVSKPQYDPFANDIFSDQQVEAVRAAHGKDSASKYLESIQTIDKRFGFNFTNVRYMPLKPSSSAFPLAPRLFSASYSFNSVRKSSPFIKDDWMRTYMGSLNYNYASQPIYIEPFKKLIKSKTRAWDWIKAINFNFIPNSITVTNQIDRSFGIFQQRQLAGELYSMPEQYIKSFTWNRNYAFDYNPFRALNLNFTAANQARIDEPQGRIDTKAKEDSLFNSIKKFGRTTSYRHDFNAKYNLPFNKIPALSFITSSLRYKSDFSWTTGPQIYSLAGDLVQSPQGNVITNGQGIGTSVNIKMAKIYSQIPFLKNADIDKSGNNSNQTKEQRIARDEAIEKDRDAKKEQLNKAKEELVKLKQEKKEIKKSDSLKSDVKKQLIKDLKRRIKEQRKRIKEQRKILSTTMVIPTIVKMVAQPIMAVREIDASYDIENATSISGYTQKTKFFGVDFDEKNHLDPMFVAGMQPGISLFAPPDKYARWRWLDDFANKGFMTKDSTFNLPFTQSNSKIFKATISLEPLKNIRIKLNWESDYTQKYSEYFVFNQLTGGFEHRNPLESGSYTYSDVNLFTSFKTIQNNGVSENVTALDKNRELYATIFKDRNPYGTSQVYIDPITLQPVNNFYHGYGPLQQDVLINSFLTTYRGEKASGGEKNLSPFSRIPLPNWNLQYNGLAQLPMFKKTFEAFSIRHGYNSRTTIANFNSELRYEGGGQITNPIKIDSLNNNYIPYYFIPNVGFSENYSPLLGIDFTLKNKMNFKFEFKKSRQVALSLIDYQLTENTNTGFTFGYGYQTGKVTLPFADAEGKNVVLNKGISISCDLTYTNNVIVNHKLGQNQNILVGGGIRLMINPKIDCQVSDKFNFQLFYNYVYNEPRISTSFPTINGSAGMKMSFSLAP